MTPRNDKHFEINQQLILDLQAIGTGHSGAQKFLS